MTRFTLLIAVLTLIVAWTAACAPENTEAVPTAAQLPTATDTPTPAPSPTPLALPTLPPTWTPTFTPTDEPIPPTPTLDETMVQSIQQFPYADICATFGEDVERNAREVVQGTPVQIYWLPVAEAFRYEVALFNDQGFRMEVDSTEEATYVFEADLFQANRLYGWTVTPYSFDNQIMCPPRGSEFRVRLPS